MERGMRLILIATWLVSTVAASQEFEAHRMLQYDRGSSRFGSRKSYVNALAGTMDSGDLSSKVLMVHMHELTDQSIDAIINGSLCAAVLVILPRNMDDVTTKVASQWVGLERKLVQAEIPIPVYFAFDGPEVGEIYSSVGSEGSTSDGYQLTVNPGEPSVVRSLQGVNLQGTLAGVGADHGNGDHLPTLAIVAHYDTASVAPSMPHGANDNGSGVLALLELARLFSKLYRRFRTQGQYNLLFVLTAAGRMNFEGTANWLEQAEGQLLQSIEFALCLDSIGNGPGLHFHVSKPAKDPGTVLLHNEFKRTAANMNVSFDVVRRKIDLSDPEVYWQHELFSRKRVLGATLSSDRHPRPSFDHVSLFNTEVDMPVLLRNIRLIAEVVAHHVYELHGENLQVFQDSLALNKQFVQAWHSVLAKETSMQSLMNSGTKDPKSAPVINGLERVLLKYLGSVKSEVFALDTSAIRFYDTTQVLMSAFRGKPMTFDLVFSGIVVAYFWALLVGLLGFRQAVREVQSVFLKSSKSNRKIK